MPQGDKSSYTNKQKRMAAHIEESYEGRGTPEDEAERIAWATVNKETGGGHRADSGSKGGERRASADKEHEKRSAAARKGWETRRKNAA